MFEFPDMLGSWNLPKILTKPFRSEKYDNFKLTASKKLMKFYEANIEIVIKYIQNT